MHVTMYVCESTYALKYIATYVCTNVCTYLCMYECMYQGHTRILIPGLNSDLGAKVTKWCDRLRSIPNEEITFGTSLDPELGKNLAVPWLMRGKFRAIVKGKTSPHCYKFMYVYSKV